MLVAGMTLCTTLGHRHLFSLRASTGHLCHHFYADKRTDSLVLFTQSKEAVAWLKKVNKLAQDKVGQRWQMLEATPHLLSEYPLNLRVTINPADDDSSVRLLMEKSFLLNW